MRILIAILLVLLLTLQYRYWFGEGSFRDIRSLESRVTAQEAENERLEARNQELRAEVEDLRDRLDAVEERARSELGLIKEGEEFFQIVPVPADEPDNDDDRRR